MCVNKLRWYNTYIMHPIFYKRHLNTTKWLEMCCNIMDHSLTYLTDQCAYCKRLPLICQNIETV